MSPHAPVAPALLIAQSRTSLPTVVVTLPAPPAIPLLIWYSGDWTSMTMVCGPVMTPRHESNGSVVTQGGELIRVGIFTPTTQIGRASCREKSNAVLNLGELLI